MYSIKSNKIHDASIQSAYALNEMTIKSIKIISDIHANAIRGISESMQRRMVEVCSTKDPLTTSEILKTDEMNDIVDQFHEYQQALAQASQDIGKEWVEIMGQCAQGCKEEVNKAFKETEANAPDGLDVFVTPLRASFENALAGFNRAQESALSVFGEFEKKMNSVTNGMQASTSQYKTKRNGASSIPIINGRKRSSKTVHA
jgi:hypothetical protein